ncbi:MAG: hypothetical protein RMM17_10280 [Acidobacteriota bacterium]|nr:hypothetical protein [Blastocatellia bacterium]MDW8413056.1 hypothetical protein [Acidobacteriota bacterium]
MVRKTVLGNPDSQIKRLVKLRKLLIDKMVLYNADSAQKQQRAVTRKLPLELL